MDELNAVVCPSCRSEETYCINDFLQASLELRACEGCNCQYQVKYKMQVEDIKIIKNGAWILITRYRYILTGSALGYQSIGDFKLISGNNIKPDYNGEVALRVVIPIDLELTKYRGDSYSTTNDRRTLDELGYDILIWYEKERKWKKHNEYKGTMPCNIH